MSGPWPGKPETLLPGTVSFVRYLVRFSRLARDADAVVLRGTSGLHEGYVELVAALLLKFRRRRPRTVIGDATWDVTSRRLEDRLSVARPLARFGARLAIRAVDGRHVIYGVLSSEELRDFPARWQVEPQRVRFVPFCATMPISRRDEASSGSYVFAGGDSYRDYDLLVAAAENLDVSVKIATSWKPSGSLPPNVSVGWLPKDEYDRALLGARAVVVPLRAAARSAGQQTYLNAMMLGKPVIVTDVYGVHDYISDGETGLITAPDPIALRGALEWVLDPGNTDDVTRMTERAAQVVKERFLLKDYFGRLWDLATAEM